MGVPPAVRNPHPREMEPYMSKLINWLLGKFAARFERSTKHFDRDGQIQ